jgi:hypothetical protein
MATNGTGIHADPYDLARAEALPLLTASRLKTARACQRLHLFEYVQGYRPAADASVMRFGTLCHAGLEAWLRSAALPPEERLGAMLAALAGEADPFDRARAEALLTGYHLRWIDDPITVLAVEVKFETELRNPETGRPSRTWRLGGKLDGVIAIDHEQGIMEHKITSEDMGPGTTYWSRLRLDGQVSTYFLGAEALGFAPAWCLYDVLKRPAQRPFKATPPEAIKLKKDGTPYAGTRLADETPEEFRSRVLAAIAEAPSDYYARGRVVRLEKEIAEARADTWQTARILHENGLRGFAPRNVDACIRFNRACPFLSVCCGEASLDDPTLYRKIESVHPELTEATDAA